MNTKQLRLFMLIADIKSFSKAAELEALTQPAVTQQISRLEREIGSVLFKRKNKRIELTKKGKLFYKFAKNMLSMVDNLEKELKIIDSTDEGILKIGSSHIPTSHMLYEKIVDFKRRYPSAYIIYELNDTENISYMVENELLDVGFVGAVVDNTLNYRSFSGDELKLVASRGLDIPSKINLSQLKEVPLIINQKESGVRKFLEKKLEEYNIFFSELNIISEIGLPETLLSIVRMGMGCAFIPSIIIDKVMNDGNLKVIEIKNFSAYRNYYMVTKKGAVLSHLAQNFLESFEFTS
ncbi:MAG TPA: LysR family transcriptional regulator [Spirochaetota bacterium]|nr:LysR family transcriptional regulator [Spirochaetota bacterium]